MTREDSILTRTWVTNGGRYLGVSEIADDHLRQELTPGSDESTCRAELAAWMTTHAAGVHAVDDEMDHDLFRAGWIQITGEEIARRSSWPA
jgi:hypothetical protein